jgi:predicted nuclease of predicted toxin-antitoxin system
MRVLLNENIAPSLKAEFARISWLNAVLHVNEVSLASQDDVALWQWACTQPTLLVTKDKDFAFMALRKGVPPKVLLLRIGNASVRETWQAIKAQILTLQSFIARLHESLLIIDKVQPL